MWPQQMARHRASGKPTSSLCSMLFPNCRKQGLGQDFQGLCGGELGKGQQVPGPEQIFPQTSFCLCSQGLLCYSLFPTLPDLPGTLLELTPLPLLFSLEIACDCTKGVQLERCRLERRAESLLKGNEVVVLRHSLHIRGQLSQGSQR